MATKIFVNLPVKDLDRSVSFFTKLGYTFNPQFTSEKGTCMIIGEDIFVMLLVEPYFKSFIAKEVADTAKTAESIICLSTDTREKVDQLISTALENGATTYKEPQDHGFMYVHAYQDLDGHLWEIMWMDAPAVSQP